MADLTSSDVTYTQVRRWKGSDSREHGIYKLTTAAGEYPTGGIPLDGGQMGCPTVLEAVKIVEPSAADAYQYYWDSSANKIKVLVDDGASGVPAEHANATFTSPDELIIEVVGW